MRDERDESKAIAEELIEELIASGDVEWVGMDQNGQRRFRITEQGKRRVEALLQGEP